MGTGDNIEFAKPGEMIAMGPDVELLEMGRELRLLCAEQSVWSQKTFGEDSTRGPLSVLKHLEEEAREAQANPEDLTEYADCFLLIIDAARRAGMGPKELIQRALVKQSINKSRKWDVSPADGVYRHIKE